MLRVHHSAVRRMAWLAGPPVGPSIGTGSGVGPEYLDAQGNIVDGQGNIVVPATASNAAAAAAVTAGSGVVPVITPTGIAPLQCQTVPTWYVNNGNGTYTRYTQNSPQCGPGQIITPAQWAAETGQASSGATGSAVQGSTAAVTPSGQTISTQTAQGLRLVNINNISPGVYQCTFSDGSKNYCDADGNPMSYTPPTGTPSITPAQGLPISSVAPTVVTQPPVPGFLGPPVHAPAVQGTPVPAVTPGNQPMNSVTGSAAPSLSNITTWLQGTLIGGIPNWMLVAGAAGVAALFMFSDGESPSPRHRR